MDLKYEVDDDKSPVPQSISLMLPQVPLVTFIYFGWKQLPLLKFKFHQGMRGQSKRRKDDELLLVFIVFLLPTPILCELVNYLLKLTDTLRIASMRRKRERKDKRRSGCRVGELFWEWDGVP